jgi:hypothetical protein
MKRLLVLLLIVGFVVALPLSHLVLAKGPAPKVEICHVTDSGSVFGDTVVVGHVISVSENALDAHLAHGDLEDFKDLTPDGAAWLVQFGLHTDGANCWD